jgi:hypothetical protein
MLKETIRNMTNGNRNRHGEIPGLVSAHSIHCPISGIELKSKFSYPLYHSLPCAQVEGGGAGVEYGWWVDVLGVAVGGDDEPDFAISARWYAANEAID